MGRFFQFMTKRKERRAQANDRSRLPYAWNKDRADTSSLSLDDATDYEEAPWRAGTCGCRRALFRNRCVWHFLRDFLKRVS